MDNRPEAECVQNFFKCVQFQMENVQNKAESVQ